VFAFLGHPPRPGVLLARAQRRTGLADFGGVPYESGLDALLRASKEEAQLSFFGRFAIGWDGVRFLSNLLQLRQAEIEAPEILAQPIECPIFITGLPRSGTTFLHQLLAQDPANRVSRVWQTIHPYPDAKADARHDRRRRRVARQLRMFQVLAPEIRSIHPINADSPQECSEITAHVFASLRFDTTYSVPSYRRWLDAAGHVVAYRFHKRFLQHLQYQAGGVGRWILKCPDHIFALDAIRAVYPDARFVFVHRDPLRVLPSVAHLTEVLRRPFSRSVDRAAIGREQSKRWLAGVQLMIGAADRQPFAEPIFHLHYRDLANDPGRAVEALYRHFGLNLTPEAASAIANTIEANPGGRYGASHAAFEDYGLDETVERERFTPYTSRFDIARELESPRRSPRRPPARDATAAPEPAD
jgi:Sulfotransferase family